MLAGEALELGDGLGIVTQVQSGVDAPLECLKPQRVEARRLNVGPRRARELAERCAAPQVERRVEHGQARRRVRFGPGLCTQALETCRVEAIRGDAKRVAARTRLERDTAAIGEELA